MDGDELSLNQLVIVHGGGTVTARGQYRLDTSRFAFDARAEGFQLEPVVLDDITVPITGRADFGFTGEGTLDATLVQGSITLSELSSDPIGLAGGTASATLRVTGPLGALAKAEVQVDLETFNATLADSPLRLAAPARLTYDAGGVSVDELGLVAEELRLEIDGRLAEGTDESLRGSLSGDLRGLTPVIRNAQLALLPVPLDLEGLGGRVDLRGSLSYDDAGLAGSADLAVDEASVALKNIPPATGIEVRASYRDGTLKLSRLRGSWQQAVLSAQATVPWASSMAPTTITARIDGMSAAVLAPLVSEETRERLELAVDAEIELELARFALDGLSGRLRLTRANASVAGMQLSQERTTQLDLSRGRLTVTDWSWAGQTNRLDGQGSLDLTRADGLDLDVRGALDLRMTNLLAPAVASSGLSNFELRLHGDPRDPLIDGTITIDGADARIATPGLVFTDLDGRLVLTGERLELVALNGLVNGGSLAVTGELHHDDFTITDGTLAIDARNVALEFPEGLQSELEARLSLEASGDSLALTGTATIVRGAYRDPISMTSRLLTAINPQTVTVRTGRDSSAVDRMSLDVAIVTDEDIIVDNNYGRFLIGFQLTGTPNSLQTDLSFEPALGQSDLVSLLLTGRTLHEAGNAGAEVARDQVLDYLSGELAGVAGRAVGLNELRLERGTRASDVRFDPGLVATETDPAARLTFGKRVSPELEVIFSQSLAESGIFTWIVNYSPRRSATLRFVSRDNEDRSYEFWHDLSFGGTPLPASRGGSVSTETIDAIDVRGDPGFDEQAILDELDLATGARFDFYRWLDSRDRLVRFYREGGYLEARVRTRRRTAGGRLSLEYEIDRGPRTLLVVTGYDVSGATRRLMEERLYRTRFLGHTFALRRLA